MSVTLRPYQERLIGEARVAFRDHRAVMVQAPTGAGKTVLFAWLARASAGKGKRVCILAHRRELVRQASAKLDDMGVPHAVIVAGSRSVQRATVSVASVQTLARRLDLYRGWFDLLVIDECHHAVAGTWRAVMDAYPEAKVLGVTATPQRLDGRGLGDVFERLLIGPSVRELMDQGFLAPYRAFAPADGPPDLSRVKRIAGDFDSRALAEVMSGGKLVGDAVEHYRRHADGLPAVAFCVTVQHAEAVAEQFRGAGYRAVSVDGSLDQGERDRRIAGLADGSVQVLTSCELIAEGLDVPGITAAILLRPTQSLGLHLQQCLDAETEILTGRGWLRHDALNDADTVAAFDTLTGNIEYCEVQEIVRRPLALSETMHGIASPHLDIRVTGGHEMIVQGLSVTCKHWRKATAEQVQARSAMFMIPVSGKTNAPGLPLSDDEVRFLGWFLSDGSINHANGVVQIAQSSDKVFHCEEIKRVLRGCGFKFGEYRYRRKGSDSKYPDLMIFGVSRGKPRGRDKHLRGWGALAPWLDKSVPSSFDDISDRQLGLLLEAINLGDGANQNKPKGWSRRTMAITCGDNERLADRLQALCVTRGFRCNKAAYEPKRGGRWFSIYVRPGKHATIAGAGVPDGDVQGKAYQRSRFTMLAAVPGETVWCVSTRLGSLVVRRNGKVAIVGNCGRALRPKQDGSSAVILDHAGNCARHGLPCQDREWTLTASRPSKKRDQATPIRTCSDCYAIMPTAATHCPGCGVLFATEREVPETTAGELVELRPSWWGEDGRPIVERRRADIDLAVTKCETWADLKELGRALGFKPGWCCAIARAKGWKPTKFRPGGVPVEFAPRVAA